MAVMNNATYKLTARSSHLALKIQQAKIKSCSKWKIFPLTINNGAIGLTETGYKPLNSKITDFGQYELILTGNTPVIVVWKNSTKIYQKNKGTTDPITQITTGQDQFYTKQYKVGNYWNAYLIEDNSGVDFSNLPNQTIFSTVGTKRQYTLLMFEEQITINDYLQFFVVFNDINENIGGPDKNQDRQILYISNVTNYYSPYNQAFSMQSITFSSINDKLQASGQTTLGFINYASPGSGYAFPTIQNGIVTLNRILMRDIGVRYSHLQTYGIEAKTSCYYNGRPVIQGQSPIQIGTDEVFEQKIFASRRLFIAGHNEYSTTDVKDNGGLYAGINDAITTNSHPETTFYNIMDASPTGFLHYPDFKAFLAASQFNIFADKSFKGILAFDKSKATNSNGSAIGNAKFFWDSEWIINNLTGSYNVEMSSNFRYKNQDNNAIIGSSAVDYKNISQKWMSSILNFNSVVFSPLIQMPYDKNQWLPFALNSIPLIGKMLNALTLGIPVGFVITQNFQQYKKMAFFNAFMSAFFTDAMDNIFGKSGLIPLNLFSSQNNFELGKLLGAKVTTNAMLMKLSDRLSIFPWDPTTGKKLTTREQISSVDLSQKKDNKVYIMAEDSEFLDIASPLTNLDTETQWNPTPNGIADGQEYAYIIDTIITQSLHQGEERHTFYSDNPYTYKGDYNELSVAQFRYNSTSTLTDNLFNWMTIYKTNHDEYEETEETTFSYPSDILPPNPQNIAKQIIYIPPNPTVSENYTWNNILDGTSDNINYNKDQWLSNHPIPNYLTINFNITDYLDPTFLINTFEDLKRFYKSITVYYSVNYSSEEIRFSDENLVNTNEIFKPSKQIKNTFPIDLNDILFNNNNINYSIKDSIDIKKASYSINPQFIGSATIGYIVNNNNLYKLNEINLSSNLTLGKSVVNTNIDCNTYLSFNVDNNLLMKCYILPTIMETQGLRYRTKTGANDESKIRYISSYEITISKIVLNPR